MTRLEQIKLNEWIAKNVMDLDFNGFHWCLKSDPNICVKLGGDCPDYLADPAQAMLVLSKCLAGIEDVHFQMKVNGNNVFYEIWGGGCRENAESLPLAIAKFSRKLYDKAEET